MSMTAPSIELLAFYPSIQDLLDECRGEDLNQWGLCQNNHNELAFRKRNEEWLLQISVLGLTASAFEQFGTECDLEDTIVFYEFTEKHSDTVGGIRRVYIEFISLQHYEDMIKQTFIPYINTWLDS